MWCSVVTTCVFPTYQGVCSQVPLLEKTLNGSQAYDPWPGPPQCLLAPPFCPLPKAGMLGSEHPIGPFSLLKLLNQVFAFWCLLGTEHCWDEEHMPFYSLHVRRLVCLKESHVQKVFCLSPTLSLPSPHYYGDSPNSAVPRVFL
jgi:hypothetical protein